MEGALFLGFFLLYPKHDLLSQIVYRTIWSMVYRNPKGYIVKGDVKTLFLLSPF